MIAFTPELLEPWQVEIDNLYKQLAIDIAAIHKNQSKAAKSVAFFSPKEPKNEE